MAPAYESGLMLDESTGIDIKADRNGDAWVTIWTSIERCGVTLTLGLEADELRELAAIALCCADAADEARQSFVSNGNGRHTR